MLIKGIIRSIIFHNEENGYTVARLYAEEEDEEITVVGHSLTIEVGRELELEGEWVFHPKYHEQFQFNSYKEHIPTTTDGILRYLSSGMLPYVGKKTAKKIVDRFGEETLEILRYRPDRLLEIEGIGQKKLEKITEAYEEQREVREILIFTQSYGISTSLAVKIYRTFGEDSMEIIKHDPYRLAEEVRGIGFITADKIAENLGISKDDPARKRGAVSFVMQQSLGRGHCYLPLDEVERETAKLLNLPVEKVHLSPTEIALNPKFFLARKDGEFHLYFAGMYRWENYVAQDICRRIRIGGESLSVSRDELDELLDEFEIKPAEGQRLAIETALEHPIMILTGGPGTGKTTVLRALLPVLESLGKKVTLAAPTGRAAKRMEETTNRPASTIHRLLDARFLDEDIFTDTEPEEELETDVLIIDEASMVDLPLMYRTLQALPDEGRLILVGDKDQLPSVGPGNILSDFIGSGIIPVVELTEIFRQEKDSRIVENAHRINHGEIPVLNAPGGDFFFDKQDKEDTANEIVSLVNGRLTDYYNVKGMDGIQVLTPMRKGVVGVNVLNEQLQQALNPPSPTKKEVKILGTLFREGDKVMQIRNNYQLTWKNDSMTYTEEGEGVFNGDTGFITEIDDDEKTVLITYDDVRKVEYTFQGMEEVRLCYATTIHKSQGSEYPVVIIPIQWAPPMLLTRNLLYTGVTRAKTAVVLVGNEKYLDMMIRNNRVNVRYTALRDKLIQCKESEHDRFEDF